MVIKNTFIHKPIQGSIKQYGLWIQENAKIVPLVFFRKPKWVPEDQWAEIVNAIDINLPKEYNIETNP